MSNNYVYAIHIGIWDFYDPARYADRQKRTLDSNRSGREFSTGTDTKLDTYGITGRGSLNCY